MLFAWPSLYFVCCAASRSQAVIPWTHTLKFLLLEDAHAQALLATNTVA
jgi:hypothetical protein